MSLFLLRTLLLSASGLIIGMSIVIAVRYGQWWKKAPDRRRGLIPLHVWTVTVSYGLLLVYATADLATRVDDMAPLSWRIFVIAPAILLGIVAMYAVGNHGRQQRLKLQHSHEEESQ